jgi:CDP-diacylglycerol--serine O-phosphatidyltransferase
MFGIPNLLTAGNLLLGVFSIFLTLQGRIDLASYCLFLAMLLDFLDGFAARFMKKHSELGKQLDSLADMVSFGVAPGALVFVLLIVASAIQQTGLSAVELLSPYLGGSLKSLIEVYFECLIYGANQENNIVFYGWSLVLPFVSFFIPFFSLFRLAKFNIDTRQSEQFLGLPTPANTIFLTGMALTFWFGLKTEGIGGILAELFVREQILTTIVVFFSVLLISEIPLIALKFKSFELKSNIFRYVLLAFSLVLIIALRQFALTFIVILYLLLSIAQNYFIKNH